MRRRLPLLAIAAIVFLVVSLGLARWLTTESRERARVHELLVAQASGDRAAMLAALSSSCRVDRRCQETVAANARRLRRAGEPKIIAYDSGTAYALGAATGTTRVAWTTVGRGLPVVQCVLVRREGTALSGRRVTLLRISAPIANESAC